MKLYYAPGTCSLSPHIVLVETQTPYTLAKADLRTKKVDDGGDFLAVNPNGYVPALRLDDGNVLTEGPAIVQYIADNAKDRVLSPPLGSLERARLQQWLNFVSTEIHKGFSPLFNAKLSADAKDIHRARLLDRIAFLDKHLASSRFLTGNTFSVADAYLFTTLTWAKPLGIDIATYPHVKAYFDAVHARPAVQQAMREQGLLK